MTSSGLSLWLRLLSESVPSSPLILFFFALILAGTAWGTLQGAHPRFSSTPAAGAALFLAAVTIAISQGFLPSPVVYFLPLSLPKAEPVSWPWYAGIFLLFIACGVWLQGWWGLRLARLLARVRSPAAAYAVFLAGFIGGIFLTRWFILQFGPTWGLALWSVACLVGTFPFRWRLLVGSASLASAIFSEEAAREPFLWSAHAPHRLRTEWSPYFRVDFYGFEDDRCLGGAYNRFLMWYVCNPPWDYLERRELFKRLAPDTRSALIIGAAGGNGVQTLARFRPDIDRIDAVEIDPVTVSRTGSIYSRFNSEVYRKPNVIVHAAEGRRFLDETSSRYDLVYYDGVDTGYLSHLRSTLTMDHYLHTQEAYRTIFEQRLNPEGVMVIELGGTRTSQIAPYLGALPSDVAVRIYWFVLSNSPMMGAPLFFILASMSGARLDAIARSLKDVPSLVEAGIPPRVSDRPPTDDRPVMDPMVVRLLAGATFIVLLLLLPLVRASWHDARKANGGRSLWMYFFLSGLTSGAVQGWVLSSGGRVFLQPADGAVILLGLHLLGSAVAGAGAAALAARRPLWKSLLLVPAGGFVLLARTPSPVSPGSWYLLSLAAGVAAGSYWAVGLTRLQPDRVFPAFSSNAIGMAAGLLLVQLAAAAFGFSQASACLAAAGCVTAVLFAFSTWPTGDVLIPPGKRGGLPL